VSYSIHSELNSISKGMGASLAKSIINETAIPNEFLNVQPLDLVKQLYLKEINL